MSRWHLQYRHCSAVNHFHFPPPPHHHQPTKNWGMTLIDMISILLSAFYTLHYSWLTLIQEKVFFYCQLKSWKNVKVEGALNTYYCFDKNFISINIFSKISVYKSWLAIRNIDKIQWLILILLETYLETWLKRKNKILIINSKTYFILKHK